MYYLELLLKLFCIVMVVRILRKRIVTAYYLTIRILSTGTATITVIMSEGPIPWKKMKWKDRFNTYCHLMYPNIFYVSDFNNYPLPYGLWERMPVWVYVRNSFLITTLVCGFYYGLFIDWNRKWLIVSWLALCALSGLAFMIAHIAGKTYVLKFMFRLIYLRAWEIMSSVTFGQTNIYHIRQGWKKGLLVFIVSSGLIFWIVWGDSIWTN